MRSTIPVSYTHLFELEDMVESVTAMLRTVLGKRRQQLSVEIEDGIHMSVVGDQQRIRQILVLSLIHIWTSM